ncbi:MAG: methyl-accepting chemotaxis protein [Pseudolabrys sp.]
MISFRKTRAGGADSHANIERQKAAIADKVTSALMMIDRDFVVTYVNESTRDLLKQHEAAFSAKWPGFQADKIVGTCIDRFHAKPEHQRKLLADPKNLPYRTEISVGDIRISLHVNGCFDAKGALTGHMLEWRDVSNEGLLEAIDKTQAVVEFRLDGTVVTANQTFLKLLGYSLEEIRNKPHSMFVLPNFRDTPEYRAFWGGLCAGKGISYPYSHLGKGGKEVWLQTSYNPVLDANGKPYKIVKFATDITEQKLKEVDYAGQIAAVSRVMATIEFDLSGNVLNANENFLNAMGYSIDEVRGHHHRMFVDKAYAESPEYRAFWEKLRRGEYDAGQYKRIGKGGKQVWLQASCNPILDDDGKPIKVVKFATDITDQVRASEALQNAVQQTQTVVKAAEASDLTQRIPMAGKSGEIATLCAGVNGLLDTMATVVKRIKAASREVSNASAEIAASTTDLSQRTEEQAASLEQTSASMEQMSATVKKNAENALLANQSASETSEVADRGGQVVAKAVDAMARIEESSGKISDIIGVIDEIARQTNLLALNAAVEAARAGDAGRGFAVVASEVRSLAQRSSQAAKDIKDLITNSGGQVKDGVELVNRAGSALTEIVGSIKKVADLVSDIATASTEQSTGIDQINRALTQMDEVTQQNSALVEENAATAKTLEQQSNTMTTEVSVFKVGDDDGQQIVSPLQRRPAAAPKAAAVRKPVRTAKPAAPAKASNAGSGAAPKLAAAVPRQATVGQMQTALAAAYEDPEWKDF